MPYTGMLRQLLPGNLGTVASEALTFTDVLTWSGLQTFSGGATFSGGTVTMSGGTINLNGGSTITYRAIVNADVSASAAIARSKLASESKTFLIRIADLRDTNGAILTAAGAAGMHNVNVSANVILAQGEVTDNTTKTDASYVQFILPENYVAAGNLTLTIPCTVVKTGAATDNASTIGINCYKSGRNGTVGADINATAAQSFAAMDTWYNKAFTITGTTLSPGDVINIKITSTITDSEVGVGTLRFNMEAPSITMSVQG